MTISFLLHGDLWQSIQTPSYVKASFSVHSYVKTSFSVHKLIKKKTLKWLHYILIGHCIPLSPWLIILDKNNLVQFIYHYLTSGGYQVCLNNHTLTHILYVHIFFCLMVIYITGGQTMVWAIFHLSPINLKFQRVILSKFNITISVVNGPFFGRMGLWHMTQPQL